MVLSKYTPVISVSGKERSKADRLYPMPANDQVYVQHDKAPAKASIIIYGLDGRMVKQVEAIPNTYQTSLDISRCEPWHYIS